MSVRVCYVERAAKGGLLRGLRLLGPAGTGEERWPGRPGAPAILPTDQGVEFYARAAEWLRGQIIGPRSSDALEVLCLDVTGAGFTWISTSSAEAAEVARVARSPEGIALVPDNVNMANMPSVVEYFASSDDDATVQALGLDAPTPAAAALANAPQPGTASKRLRLLPTKRGAASDTDKGASPARGAQRVGVLAAADVPARLLLDALDARGVRVGSVLTIWHALAQAWTTPADTAQAQTTDDPLVQRTTEGEANPGAPTAVVIVDAALGGGGGLAWCWAHEGTLLAGGFMRLRVVGADSATAGGADPSVVLTREDIGRLASEWLAWGVQVAARPSRVVCVLPTRLSNDHGGLDAGGAAQLIARAAGGEALARLDAAVDSDPLGTTLRKLAGVLEATEASATPTAGQALVATSQRAGSAHRRLYLWGSAALFALAGALGVAGMGLHRQAEAGEERAAAWGGYWRPLAQEIYPAALSPRPGLTAEDEIDDEIARRKPVALSERDLELSRPVLTELDAISLVVGVPDVTLREITLDSARAEVVLAGLTTEQADGITAGLSRVGGSVLTGWSYREATRDGTRVFTYSARWPARPTGAASGGGTP